MADTSTRTAIVVSTSAQLLPRPFDLVTLHPFMRPAVSAVDFLPKRLSLKALREAAEDCRGCDLYKNATQTVFGEGPRNARLFLVGETPGDEEDKQGHPFVG